MHSNKTSNNIVWLTANKQQRDLILVQAVYASFSFVILEENARRNWLFTIKSLVKSFTHVISSLKLSILSFTKFFYRNIRELQLIIPIVGAKVKDFNKFKFLQNISPKIFIRSLSFISLFNSKIRYPNNVLIITRLLAPLNNLNSVLNIISNFGIELNFPIDSRNNFYTFLFYLKLYELEEILQWLNWVAFYIRIQNTPYKFKKNSALSDFIFMLNKFGYQIWYSKHFHSNTNLKTFKLKKKWRFWRDFRKGLMFDKAYVFIRLSWLFNHKRLLNYQYKNTYSINMQSKIKHIYKKKIGKSRLFSYLINIEFRVDILSMRIFKIKSIKLTCLLLYFGYFTVNLKKKQHNYVAQKGDFFFGWFLLKNTTFFRKFRVKLYGNKRPYTSLEHELGINSFICLSLPIKYPYYMHNQVKSQYNKDRLISNKFIKYTYLKTY